MFNDYKMVQVCGSRPRAVWWLIGLSMIFVHAASVSAQERVIPLERIGIRTGENEAQFILKTSGRPFFPNGFNYIRLRAAEGETDGDHSTFDAETKTTKGCYDAERAEQMFVALNKAGYNTVRVFIIGRSSFNPGIAGNFESTKELYEPYMLNVLDFLRRATRHGIRVLPTFGDGDMPQNAYYRDRFNVSNYNAFYLTKSGIAARVEHIVTFLMYIKDKEPELLPTLLGVECQNELYLHADEEPFTQTNGMFSAANGKSYDLSQTVQRQALMDEGIRFYHQRIVDAVKAVDNEILVAEGVFVPRAVGKAEPSTYAGLWPGKTKDERYPPTLTSIGDGALDFLDVHFYRSNPGESVDQAFQRNMQSTGFFTPELAEIHKEKPIIMGEFGAFDFVEKTFKETVTSMVRVRDLALKENMNGMLYWTYDCFEQARLYHAAEDWDLFVQKMGNFTRDAGAGEK